MVVKIKLSTNYLPLENPSVAAGHRFP